MSIARWPRTLKIAPASKEQTANVTARAVLALSVIVGSDLPAAPKPLIALNIPGKQKHTSPRIATCANGLV